MKLSVPYHTAILCSVLFVATAHAQSAYSMHKLEAGETLSILAKNYHTTVGDIMRMNSMNAQSQLHAGQQIKIPAGGVVVPAQKPVAAAPALTAAAMTTPKTHVVAVGETLFHISQVYHVPMDQLKAMNNLPDGNVKVGQTLVLSGTAPAPQITKAKAEPSNTTVKETTLAPVKEAAPQMPPVRQSAPVANMNAPVVTQPQKTTPAATVAPPADNTEVVVQDNSNAFNNNYASPVNAPKEGFFTSLYGQGGQSKQEQVKDGSAMTFKSASGWADKKYYILMNDAPTGSIVKIKNGKNELYAKVLWSLGEMKENDGLAFRISTAAAAALGVTDQKFDLKVSYYE